MRRVSINDQIQKARDTSRVYEISLFDEKQLLNYLMMIMWSLRLEIALDI